LSVAGTITKLNKAKQNKNDEFYTRYEDIESFINQYQEHLKDKVIYCNCDDPSFSNFYKFFKINFTKLGLKRLISTYKSDDPYRYDYDGINEIKTPIESGLFEYNSDIINEFKDDIIVITNPPFSLMRLYINFIISLDIKFIIIAPVSIISSVEIFDYFKQKKIWALNRDIFRKFITPDNKIAEANSNFFGNIEPKIPYYKFTKTYNNKDYQKYVNSDCLCVNKTENIPYDYKGYMAVPLSALYILNKNQYNIIANTNCRNIFNEIIVEGNQYKISNSIKTPTKALSKRYFIELPENQIPKSNYYIIENNDKFKDKKFIIPFAKIIIKLKSI